MKFKKLSIGVSEIDRNGVFAGEAVSKGEALCRLEGKEIDIAEIERIYLSGTNRISADGYQISDETYLFLDEFSGSVNHSCDPNCGVIERSTLVALRDIAEGEEITYDYSTVEWSPRDYIVYDYAEWPMSCRCAAQACRKFITCFPNLPGDVRQKYIESGMLPDHVKRKLAYPAEDTRCLVCEHVLRVRGGSDDSSVPTSA